MSLREQLAATAKRGKPGPRCQFCAGFNALSDEDKATVVELLLDQTVFASDIARIMRAHGISTSGYTVARHRRGECKEME